MNDVLSMNSVIRMVSGCVYSLMSKVMLMLNFMMIVIVVVIIGMGVFVLVMQLIVFWKLVSLFYLDMMNSIIIRM